MNVKLKKNLKQYICYDQWFKYASQPTGWLIIWLAGQSSRYVWKNYAQSDDWLASWLTGIFEPLVVTCIIAAAVVPNDWHVVVG